tara:strand:- start:621 stop:842 length:222 start_codon:yes stop_codon:yes gene_type:complete
MAMVKVLRAGRYAVPDNVRVGQFELKEGEVKDLPDSLAESMIKNGHGEDATIVVKPKAKTPKSLSKRTAKAGK